MTRLPQELERRIKAAIEEADLNIKGKRFESADIQESNIASAFESDIYKVKVKPYTDKSDPLWKEKDREYGDLIFSDDKSGKIYIDIKVSSSGHPERFPAISMHSICSFCKYGDLKNKFYVCIRLSDKKILFINAQDVYDMIQEDNFPRIYPCITHSREDNILHEVIGETVLVTSTRSYVMSEELYKLIGEI